MTQAPLARERSGRSPKKPHSSQALNQQTVTASLQGKLGGAEQPLIISSHFVCHHNAKTQYKEKKKNKHKKRTTNFLKILEWRLYIVHYIEIIIN